MSPLAQAIYDLLRQRVPTTGEPRLAYTDLIGALHQFGFPGVSLSSSEGNDKFRKALEEIVDACHARSLPCIVALIVQADRGRLGYPGSGYFSYVHPKVKDKEERLVLWGRELEAVKTTTYPEI